MTQRELYVKDGIIKPEKNWPEYERPFMLNESVKKYREKLIKAGILETDAKYILVKDRYKAF